MGLSVQKTSSQRGKGPTEHIPKESRRASIIRLSFYFRFTEAEKTALCNAADVRSAAYKEGFGWGTRGASLQHAKAVTS